MNDINRLSWDLETQQKFDQMLSKIPEFLRPVAQKKVSLKAEDLVRKEGRLAVTEKDMVNAFFAATPYGFHGPMKSDMREFNIDYQKYGHAL